MHKENFQAADYFEVWTLDQDLSQRIAREYADQLQEKLEYKVEFRAVGDGSLQVYGTSSRAEQGLRQWMGDFFPHVTSERLLPHEL